MQPVQEGEAIQVGRACESDGRACAQLLRPYAPAAGGRWRRRGRSGNQGAGRQVRCRGKRHGGRQTPAARSGGCRAERRAGCFMGSEGLGSLSARPASPRARGV